LSEFETEEMLEQILSALRYLKNQFKIIHRDIKPANILILEDGTYCLTDFGISKLLEMD
jgi:serine/threonine protein kinase